MSLGSAAIPQDSPEVGVPWLYTGLVAFSFIWAFADAYAIGANDVVRDLQLYFSAMCPRR